MQFISLSELNKTVNGSFNWDEVFYIINDKISEIKWKYRPWASKRSPIWIKCFHPTNDINCLMEGVANDARYRGYDDNYVILYEKQIAFIDGYYCLIYLLKSKDMSQLIKYMSLRAFI